MWALRVDMWICFAVILWQAQAGTPLRTPFNEANADVILGTSFDQNGLQQSRGGNLRLGLQIAFNEWNDNHSAPKIGLIAYNDASIADNVLNNTRLLVETDHVFALVGFSATYLQPAVVQYISTNTVPCLGSFSGDVALRNPFNKYFVNFRASIVDEIGGMMKFVVETLYEDTVVVIYENSDFWTSARDAVTSVLRNYRMRISNQKSYTNGNGTLAALSIIDSINGSFLAPPAAVLLLGEYTDMAPIITVAQQYWPSSYYFATSFVGTKALTNAIPASKRQRLFISQAVPNPDFDTSAWGLSYRNALNMYAHGSSTSYTSMEGYYVGVWVAQYISKVWKAQAQANPGLNRSSFNTQNMREQLLSRIYSEGVSEIGSGFRLGPFGTNDATCTEPENGCSCNQGGRSVFGCTFEPTTGSMIPAPALDFTFSTCGFSPTFMTATMGLTIVQTGILVKVGNGIRQGLLAAFLSANAAGTLGTTDIQLKVYNDDGNSTLAGLNAAKLINFDRVFALVSPYQAPVSAAVAAQATLYQVPMVGAMSGSLALRNPFQPRIINLRATLLEEVAAQAFIIKDLLKNVSLVATLSWDDTLGRLYPVYVDQSLRAVGLTLLAKAFYPNDYSPNATVLTASLKAITASSGGVVPQVLGVHGLFFQTGLIIKLAHQLWPQCIFLMSSISGQDSVVPLLDPASIPTIYCGQVVPLFSDQKMQVSKSYLADLATQFPGATPSPLGLEAYMAARLIVSVMSYMPPGSIARQYFQDAVFAQGNFPIDDFLLGPYVVKENATVGAGTPGFGCNQGLHTVWITTYSPQKGKFAYVPGTYQFDFSEDYYCNIVSPKCHRGWYRSDSSGICSICPVGGYVSSDGTQCIPCEAGHLGTTDATGTSTCSACPPGTYSGSIGVLSCSACVGGQVSSDHTQCILCEAGQFGTTDATGTSMCSSCPEGTYSGSNGASSCSTCGVGFTSMGTFCVIAWWAWVVVGVLIAGPVVAYAVYYIRSKLRKDEGKQQSVANSGNNGENDDDV